MATVSDTRPGGWRQGWFLDSAPKSLVCVSSGGGDVAGGYYFEATIGYIGGSGHSTYDFSPSNIGIGFADASAPLFSNLTNGGNVLSVPNHAMWATFAGITANTGVDHCSGVMGHVIAFAINTASKKIWTKNLTLAGAWNPASTPPQDPGTPSGGISYSGTLSGSLYLIGAALSAQGGLPAPPAPTLTSSASPGAPGGTVFVRTAYINASGGGMASKVASITLAANTVAVVTSPAAPDYGSLGVGGYAVFAGPSADTCVLQNGATAVNVGTNFTCAGTLVTGSAKAPYAKATINTGGSAFTGSLPTGFSAWGATDTFNALDNSNVLLSNGNLTVSSEGINFIPTDYSANLVRDIFKKVA